jgi:hypothetical protein
MMKGNLEPFAVSPSRLENRGYCSFVIDGQPVPVIPTPDNTVPPPFPTCIAARCHADFIRKEAELLDALDHNPFHGFSRYFPSIESMAREVILVSEHENLTKGNTYNAYVTPFHDHLVIGTDELPFPLSRTSPLEHGYLPTRYHSCTCFTYPPAGDDPSPRIDLNPHPDDMPYISYSPNRPTNAVSSYFENADVN